MLRNAPSAYENEETERLVASKDDLRAGNFLYRPVATDHRSRSEKRLGVGRYRLCQKRDKTPYVLVSRRSILYGAAHRQRADTGKCRAQRAAVEGKSKVTAPERRGTCDCAAVQLKRLDAGKRRVGERLRRDATDRKNAIFEEPCSR